MIVQILILAQMIIDSTKTPNESKPIIGGVYWTFNIAYLPVQVEILELDTKNRMARINQGWVLLDKLYKSEDECPQR